METTIPTQCCTFTAEETKLIWEAIRYSTCAPYSEARDRQSEAMRIVASELQKAGVFPVPKVPA